MGFFLTGYTHKLPNYFIKLSLHYHFRPFIFIPMGGMGGIGSICGIGGMGGMGGMSGMGGQKYQNWTMIFCKNHFFKNS